MEDGVTSECPQQCGGTTRTGNEIQGEYDGILFWVCDLCGMAYQRHTAPWLRDKAEVFIAVHNGARDPR